MRPGLRPLSPRKPLTRATIAGGLAILLLPTVLLFCASLRTEGNTQQMLGVGAVIQIVILSFLILARRWWEHPIGHTATILYLLGLAWMWMSGGVLNDWFSNLAQCLLL